MPNCLQLTRLSNQEAGPVVLQEIDHEICQWFLRPTDEEKWFFDWYNCIGFRLAMGKTFAEVEAQFDEYIADREDGIKPYYAMMKSIVGFLEERFTPNAWAEVGRR